ncbi:fimbrial protein [Citrobacter sp. Cs237]|uniref:fimbrial protein n=1 Tax=Citrobacter TaxID=544 RepID=UPI0025786B51|nr:fimbrial protein [Citrobacter sp. Cs237]MDM2749282.1 fimbrial protein [Citrobacter sp. Cs237]HBU8850343.1 type 1 fimbrial protein [Citrobacter sedlakii]
MKMNLQKSLSRKKRTILAGLVLMSGLCISEKTLAECQFVAGIPTGNPGLNYGPSMDPSAYPLNMTFPFNISRLTGSSEPVGTSLYNGWISFITGINVECTNNIIPENTQYDWTYESAPLGIWTGDIGIYSGKIYNTGIEGIGMVLQVSNGSTENGWPAQHAVPIKLGTLTEPGNNSPSNVMNNYTLSTNLRFHLIKTGPISYGTINGALLPTATVKLEISDGTTLSQQLVRLNFSGIISINKPTCSASEGDKIVRMGSHQKRNFNNIGDASEWVDSSLTMICDDAFYGQGGTLNKTIRNTDTLNFYVDDYPANKGNAANTWAVRFTSSTGLIDATQGIIALDTSNGDNATGVGIQLSSAPDDAGVMDLNSGWGGTIDLGSSTFRVPVYARYIRTGDITGGSANGKVIYTIDYQ